MYQKNRHRTRITKTGLTLVIVPRPTLLGVILAPSGLPLAVKYPDHHYSSKTGYKTYLTLKGIDQIDFDRIKPDLVIYELQDGTRLQAGLELFDDSIMGSNNATSTADVEQFCFIHPVPKLRLVEMPELEELPMIDYSKTI
jgi:hypothetical protein